MQGGLFRDELGGWHFNRGFKSCDRGRSQAMRRIRTTQERRQTGNPRYKPVVDGFRVTGKRRRLPISWDEIPRRHERGWKRHRDTQYKAREVG
jgi:hypothetical protein